MFDYFYGPQAEQFAFYRVPKVLFTNDRFKYLSAEAKTLYGILPSFLRCPENRYS